MKRQKATAVVSLTVTTEPFLGTKDTVLTYRTYANYLRNLGRSEGTVDKRTSDIRRFEQWFGSSPLLAQHDDLMRYRLTRLADAKPEYLRHVFVSFRAFFRWATAARLILADPAVGLPHVKRSRSIVQAIPDDQAHKAYLEAPNDWVRALVILVGSEALRRTEAASLHPRNRFGRRLEIIGKGGKVRNIPLDDNAYEALLALERAQGREAYYFPGRFGGHIHPCTVYKWLLALSGWNTHAFRKRAATIALKSGVKIRTVQEYLGHDSLDTTMGYLEVTWDDLEGMSQATAFPSASTRHRVAGGSSSQTPRVIQVDLDNPTREQFLLIMEAAKKLFAA